VKRILIETGLGKGIEEYGNMGDVSMLQVAIDRLHKLFPETSLEVLTDSAENLARLCPAATPLDNLGRSIWFGNGVLQPGFREFVPGRFVDPLVRLKRAVASRFPNLVRSILRPVLVRRLRSRTSAKDAGTFTAFTQALQNADLLLICGAGGFYDGCHEWNRDTLDLIEAAIQRNIPVVMFGQGFGPLTDPLIVRRAAEVLPLVNFITLRGGRGSFDRLRSLGVDESKLEITGDESLELAYEARSEKRGQGLGVNIRYLASAFTDDDDMRIIGPVLRDFARQHHVPLIPLPIAIQVYTRDDLAIKQLLSGFDEESDGGKTLDSPLKVIQQASLCRVVVTGAYHAAVFALAQGIPVIALAKSAYFSNKMLGLEDQFGEGCQTILLNQPDLRQRLHSAIESAWQNADRLREPLQTAALRQIESSRRSYERLKNLAAGLAKMRDDYAEV
jgi:colanic acid/amylovoran biosynthesis protein